jgi:uncharacterized OB-fold protein
MTAGWTGGDWTAGEPAIAYQACGSCQARWYFRRGFCPRCGGGDVALARAAGTGTVYATTLVARAPTEALRPHAPYLVLLVDADEGFRLMAHGDPALRIGDRVQARFVRLADRLIPYFDALEGG